MVTKRPNQRRGYTEAKRKPWLQRRQAEGVVTSGGEGPGGAAVALVPDGLQLVGPLVAGVERLGQRLVLAHLDGRHAQHVALQRVGPQPVAHPVVQRHAPQVRVVRRSPPDANTASFVCGVGAMVIL